jgi:ABC-type polysaccharide/polyol phosphate transport system ATPase subunit
LRPLAIELRDVHKRYRLYRQRYQSIKEVLVHRRRGDWEDHWALRGLTLAVQRGTSLGLIGPNGAGKSTALKLMARILAPDRGRVSVAGRVYGLLELGAAFQLDYSGRENLYLNASLLGLSRKEIDRRYESIVDFSELGAAIHNPLRTYSSGMFLRLAFAIAVHVEPDVLLVDEVLAVGDHSFQKKCLNRIASFQAAGGTIVVVAHNLQSILEICNEVAWIEDGVLRRLGPPMEVVNEYLDRVRETDAERDASASPESLRPVARTVSIDGVRLLDRRGEPASVLEAGDPLTIEIPYHVSKRVDKPVIGVALHRKDGVCIFATNTLIDGLSLGPLTHNGQASLQLRDLPLLAGTYRLSVAVHTVDDYTPLDWHDQAYDFRVLAQTGEQGLVRIQRKWEFN